LNEYVAVFLRLIEQGVMRIGMLISVDIIF